jgi:periplasmic divalent cation tolerance protein
MSDDTPLVVLCTTPSAEVGAALARKLVEAKLAACVNIIPAIRSIYRWQGETKDDAESQLVIKTQSVCYPALERLIRDHHPYDEPEIIALPITRGSPSYLSWLRAETDAG